MRIGDREITLEHLSVTECEADRPHVNVSVAVYVHRPWWAFWRPRKSGERYFMWNALLEKQIVVDAMTGERMISAGWDSE